MSEQSADTTAASPSLGALEQRLATARAERAKLAEQREAREAERALLEQIEAEELALKDEQAIQTAEAQYGPLGKAIAAVHTRSGVVILKRPNHVLFRRFQDTAKVTVDECEKLVRPSIVHPDKAAFDRYAEAEPAIILRAANACAALSGVRAEEVSGK